MAQLAIASSRRCAHREFVHSGSLVTKSPVSSTVLAPRSRNSRLATALALVLRSALAWSALAARTTTKTTASRVLTLCVHSLFHVLRQRREIAHHRAQQYNCKWPDGQWAQGGYSTVVVGLEKFCFAIPEEIKLEDAASMFCGGLTVFSPLVRNGCGPGKRVAVVGIGG